jgi:hypothetical protein
MRFRTDKFFVLRLGDRHFRPSPEMEIEIQLLDGGGREVQSVYLKKGDVAPEVNGFAIPPAVIDAAWRQQHGQGDYVDSRGETVPPF